MTALTMSAFTNVQVANQNQRLRIDHATDSPSVQVAREGFKGRVLTWLGGLPVFRNIDAVKTYFEQVNIQNKEAVQTFLKTISDGSEAKAKAIGDYLTLSASPVPLTQRLIQQLKARADRYEANVALLKETSARWGEPVAKTAFFLLGIQAKAEDDSMATKASPDTVTLNTTLETLTEQQSAGALGGLAKAQDLAILNGESLRENHGVLASAGGALRSVITGLSGLGELKTLKATAFTNELLNLHVAGIKFSQWGTNNGPVSEWLNQASDAQVAHAARQLNAIATEITKLKVAVEKGEKVEGLRLTPSRFKNSDVPVNPETQVWLNDGRPMPVNNIVVDGETVALAGSYPKDIEAHMRMLVEQKCTSLTVLAGAEEISAKSLPPYFQQTGDYGAVKVTSELQETHNFGNANDPKSLKVAQYQLTISTENKTVTLPVLHALNWPDRGALQSAEQLEALARLFQKVSTPESEYANAEPKPALPMVHCLGGVGRTGTLIATHELLKNPAADVVSIVNDMRATRNPRMLEDKVQREHVDALSARYNAQSVEDESIYANEPIYANA
ncbi:MAG: hypothetical protein JO226_22080 [Pluralibacter sp.]|nr:hypothetical protein [Pluralibacter sp.]